MIPANTLMDHCKKKSNNNNNNNNNILITSNDLYSAKIRLSNAALQKSIYKHTIAKFRHKVKKYR